jgi:hypothetical protein
MLHIATVHWRIGTWIDIQLKFLRKYVSEPFLVYAFLDHSIAAHSNKFHCAAIGDIVDHAAKLNRLGEIIQSGTAKETDRLLFLDGDAFPIAELSRIPDYNLEQYPLVAVQRLENGSEKQPHPCFCLTTVGLWKRLCGDWAAGYEWEAASGRKVTDVGGNLLRILEERGVCWLPIHRSNNNHLHPVWFGIYAGVVYHHGAGFRNVKVCRADLQAISKTNAIRNCLVGYGSGSAAVTDWTNDPLIAKINRRNSALSSMILERILQSDSFYTSLY